MNINQIHSYLATDFRCLVLRMAGPIECQQSTVITAKSIDISTYKHEFEVAYKLASYGPIIALYMVDKAKKTIRFASLDMYYVIDMLKGYPSDAKRAEFFKAMFKGDSNG